jgi:glutaminyl-tRNA synthetase
MSTHRRRPAGLTTARVSLILLLTYCALFHPLFPALHRLESVVTTPNTEKTPRMHFLRQAISDDIAAGKNDGRVHTRFPPEPNGYMHIGHAKAFCLNHAMAQEFGGLFNLRFDDTNPCAEESEFVESIQEDVRWMGCDWGERMFFASDYFEQIYDWAVEMIGKGKAYVCDLTAEEISAHRGSWTEPGRNSPYRGRSPEENLDLFERMRAGEFDEGARVLRAKIDMKSPNQNMRDPVMYRIRKVLHDRTGDKWCIYPFYDWAHGLEDSIEGVTHSLCSLEFENHRPLYDWYLDALGVFHPQQIEFARMNLTYTVMSKRKLGLLVAEDLVSGWDDPRIPTLAGLRRRGFTAESIRDLLSRIGMSKADNTVDFQLLQHCLRDDLNQRAPRVMVVLDPLKVVIENYPEGQTETMTAVNNPEDASMGTRELPFAREIYIERDDFREEPPKKFFRLAPGKEVRLMHAYFITCNEVVKDPETGEITELRCSYDPETRGGSSPDGRKVKGTLHWVSAAQAVDAELRLYDHLFNKPFPEEDLPEGGRFTDNLNPDSIELLTGSKLEPGLAAAKPGERFQFIRQGYFCADSVDSKPGAPVFNRSVPLRDSWAKIERKQKGS